MANELENMTFNPLSGNAENENRDFMLIQAALDGNKKSLEQLVAGHQAWIYNIAFKMIMDHDDAADITQEILIKIITNLASYNPDRGNFRTWAYRIMVNHILNMKKKKFELRIHDFDRYITAIENLPDDRSFTHPDAGILAEEVKTGCMMGMLLCLKRPERVAFLLGAVFAVSDTVGSDLMDVSRGNFRQLLSRSRRKVYQYMNGNCGHMNPANKCRCSLKVKSFLDLGMLDTAKLRYHRPSSRTVKDMLGSRLERFHLSYYEPFLTLFREQPFYDPPDVTSWLDNILKQKDLKAIFNLQEE